MSADTLLQRAVLTELNWDPRIEAGHIGVVAQDGVVTLTGHVASFIEKRAAEIAAHRVHGVKGVVEEIDVRLPDHSHKTDDEIAAAVVGRLASDASIPEGAIVATVENGFVSLKGEVEWNYLRNQATDDIHQIEGITGISNQITIKPKVDVELISDEIVHALHRSWFFDPKTIDVKAYEGIVTLSGSVKTPHERQLAAATAWAAPGVTDVRNELFIA